MCWLYRRKSCGNLRRNFMTALPFTIRQTKTTKPTSQGSKACLNAVTIAKGNRLAMTVNVSGVFLWRPNCQLYKVTGITKKIATRNSKPRFDSFVLAVHAPVRKKNRDKIQLVIPMIFINIFSLIWPGVSGLNRNFHPLSEPGGAALLAGGQHLSYKCHAQASLNGRARRRLGCRRAKALAKAGASGGRPGSPMPFGASALGTMCTAILGISVMRGTT